MSKLLRDIETGLPYSEIFLNYAIEQERHGDTVRTDRWLEWAAAEESKELKKGKGC